MLDLFVCLKVLKNLRNLKKMQIGIQHLVEGNCVKVFDSVVTNIFIKARD